jgi:GR25 family glycosyltransferase involved in LPS biosynthesis
MNFNFYKLFNPDLKKLNNSQLNNHWNLIGYKNDYLHSIESFLKKYYYYNNDMYKLYNPDILINDKIELMVHWHLYGIHEYRICSDEHFKLLYPDFDIKNYEIIDMTVHEFKIFYHKNKINNIQIDSLKDESENSVENNDNNSDNNDNNNDFGIKYLLNPNKETIGIIINNSNFINNNYFLKALSLINYHNMNILLFIDNIDNISNIIFLKNIYYFLSTETCEKKLCNYLIYDIFDNDENITYSIFKKIFINNKNDFNKISLLSKYVYIIDDLFDTLFLENNILITEFNNYIINNNKLYKIENNIESNIVNIYNKLYISENTLNYDTYKNFNINNDIKIIKFNQYDYIDDIKYGIILYKDIYYYKLFDKYSIIDFNILKLNIPLNIDHIYVEEYTTFLKKTHSNLNFKMNIIFIINETNKDNYIYNLLFLLKESYNNYNLIIFLNNVQVDDLEKYTINKEKKENNTLDIYIFKSNILLSNIDIILYLTELANNNSIILVIDNNYLINPLFSLEFINNLFFSKKILFTDYYSNENINLLIFKKELLLNVDILNKIDDSKYIEILYTFLKKKSFNKNFLKNNSYSLDQEYFCVKPINLINNYYAKFMDNYSDEKGYILNENFNIIRNINYEKLINLKNLIKNDDKKELNFLIDIYKNNIINYYYFENNLIKKIKNIISTNQIIIFLNSSNISEQESNDFYSKILKYKNSFDDKYQFNIIEFGNYITNKLEFYDSNNINYYFLNITNFNENKLNILFAYNLISRIFIKYLFNYKNLIFCEFSDINNLELIKNINNYLLMKNIEKIIFINKKVFENIGNFDPELFTEYNEFALNYFFEKVKKKCSSNKYEINDLIELKSPTSSFENLLNIQNNYNNSNFQKNHLLKLNKNDNILFDFIQKRNSIDYNLWNNIKTVIINLDSRNDRLISSIKECEKVGIYNYERFSGINIDNTNFKNYKLIDPKRAWKKNIEYLKSASGCKMSHLEVFKKYKNCNEEYIMILEDDVIFEEHTVIYLNLALSNLKKGNFDFDILYLSINLKSKDDAKLVNNNLLSIENGLTTTAQIFKKSNIDKIINIIQSSTIEIDNTYNKYLANKYCVYPMCVYQKESYSDINKEVINYGWFHKKFSYDE